VQLTPQMEKAAPGPIEAASHQDSISFTLSGEHTDSSGDFVRLQALRTQLARHGLSAFALCGSELLVTGPGVSQLTPDVRGAWIVLRALEGRLV
jgi:hypothetical protein